MTPPINQAGSCTSGVTAESPEVLEVVGRTDSTSEARQMRKAPGDTSANDAFNGGSDTGSAESSAGNGDRFAVIVPMSKKHVSEPAAAEDELDQSRAMVVFKSVSNFFKSRSKEASAPAPQATPAGELLFKSQLSVDSDYLSRTTEGAECIELDACTDICLMPNRTGTRGPGAGMTARAQGSVNLMSLFVPPPGLAEAQIGRVADALPETCVSVPSQQMRLEPVDAKCKIKNCFMCHPDAGQIVVMDREFRVRDAIGSERDTDAGVMITINKKPYTDKEHLLVFPTKHMPQAYNADLFDYSLQLLAAAASGNKLIDGGDDDGETHNYTVLFAGPVGGSQSHHHQHLINKKTNLQSYIEANPQSIKRLVFADNPNNGVFRISSEALKSFDGDAVFKDLKRGELRFFDCLMVKGGANYVQAHTTKLINHFNEEQADGSVRARYNMAILPIDDDGNYRSIIFPRATEAGTDHIKRPILWGENTFPPSAHEMCGHWFMTKRPVNNSTVSKEQFDYKVRRAIYKAAHDVRAPIDTLALEKLYADEVTLVPSAGVHIDAAHSTPDFPAATWHGWDDLAVDGVGVQRNPVTKNVEPLKACLEKPAGLRRDTDFLKPEMSQTQVNELYETLDFVAKLFKKFEVPYFGGAGTSLSAVRHGGQMPNDDDADLFLPDYAETLFKRSAVQDAIASQGYRVDTYSEWNAEKETHLVYQIRKNDGRNIKDVPFVDIAFMKDGTHKDKPVWTFSVGRKDGSRSYYRLPKDGFEPENMREIAFGRRQNAEGEEAFSGVPLMVPNEENVMFHLDGAYGERWYETNFVPGVGPLFISDRGHIPYTGDKLK